MLFVIGFVYTLPKENTAGVGLLRRCVDGTSRTPEPQLLQPISWAEIVPQLLNATLGILLEDPRNRDRKHNRHFPLKLASCRKFQTALDREWLTISPRQRGTPSNTRIVNSSSVRPLDQTWISPLSITLPEEKIRRWYSSNSRSSTIETDPHEAWSSSCRFIRRHEEIEDRCIAKQQFWRPAEPAARFCDVPNTNPAFKPRASQQNFAVAISAETDHFDAAMILEHKGYSIEAFATPTMTWSEAEQEKYRLLGPCESFQSRTDAEAWEPLSSCWVDRIRTRVVGIKSFCRGSCIRPETYCTDWVSERWRADPSVRVRD